MSRPPKQKLTVYGCSCVLMFCVFAFLQIVSSLRRSAGQRSWSTRRARLSRRASPSAAAAADSDGDEEEEDDEYQSTSSVQSTAENERTSTAVVAVNVTGATFTRQRTYLQSLKQTSQLQITEIDDSDNDYSVQFVSVVRARPPSSRRSSAAYADVYGFVVAADVVRRVPSVRQTAESTETMNRRRAMSETREYRHRQQEMAPSSSTSAVPAVEGVKAGQESRGRTTVRRLKRKNSRATTTSLTAVAGSEKPGICSWRHSLCAGFKSSKGDLEDLWTESRPERTPSSLPSTSSSVMVSVMSNTPKTTKQSRSQSLPRSFRSSFIAPLRQLLSSRSLSSASDMDTGSGVERPASRRLVRAASDSGNPRATSRATPPTRTTTTDAEKTTKNNLVGRSRSLERGSRRHPQQPSLSHTTSLNSCSRTSSQSRKNTTASSSSLSGARQVYVERQDQPWIRPSDIARVRRRRAADVDRYQSSSGTLLLFFALTFLFYHYQQLWSIIQS